MTNVTEFGHLENPRDVQVIVEDSTTLAVTTVGSMDNNCYLLCSGGDALLIDAADDAEHLLALADTLKVRITDVLTTHQHFDHVRALRDIVDATSARHHAPRLDAADLPVPADETYGTDDGSPEALRLKGNVSELGLRVVELRGHTPGGLAVIAELPEDAPRAFVGDSVFPGGVGKTNSTEDFGQLLDDVEGRIFSLPAGTRIHPGHGDSTTVGEEADKVEQWRSRGW
ncbi:MBL fold metallo-hydrolase [Corynebacterium heidelbergense]|uniref:Zn-dependent hydrolase n=1 Tax=Corynebacterium heidelbergense TaxID=2055947 RepID=A0A364V6S2_9CORY|nr:MBL fold metallo-hydrolase [Corynebacterium heidelbergense]RAV32363.1 Zn-dependent hydrolase [Corynebacterium heidelbergense]